MKYFFRGLLAEPEIEMLPGAKQVRPGRRYDNAL